MKTLVLGIEHMEGVSDKGNGRPYNMHRANIIMQNPGWKNEHGQSIAYGHRQVEQPMTKDCFAECKHIDFPAMVEFEVTHEAGRNGLQLVFAKVKDHQSLNVF